jgi:hypothetical protein
MEAMIDRTRMISVRQPGSTATAAKAQAASAWEKWKPITST